MSTTDPGSDVAPAQQPASPAVAAPAGPPAGWYDSGDGRQRWYDGTTWTEHYQAAVQQQPVHVTVTAPVQTDSRKARDKAVYTRQQKGHSIILWVVLSFCVIGIPWLIYYSVSPNHYWHA